MAKHEAMVQMFIDGQSIWQVTETVEPDLVFRLTQGEMKAVASGIKELLADLLSARSFVEKVPFMEQEAEVNIPKTARKKHGQ